MTLVTIIMGSKSDRKIAEKAEKILDEFGIAYETRVASAHRTPHHTVDIVQNAPSHVFIAIAGLAAHLPGVVAAHTLKPVIAVPTSHGYGANFGGITPLLAMLNSCAAGVLVVNINNGFGAGFAASLINRLTTK